VVHIILRSRLGYLLLALPVVLSALACKGSAEENLTDHERKTIMDVVGPVGDRVGFDVIIPSYLPKAISRDVKADSHSDERRPWQPWSFRLGIRTRVGSDG